MIVLFMKENADQDNCPIYKESRWKDPNDGAEKGAADVVADGINNNKSGRHVRSYAVFLLLLGCKEFICMRAHRQK